MRALSWTAPSSIPPQPPRSSPTAAVWPLGGRRCPRRPCRRCCSTGVGIAAPAHQHGPGPAHCHPQCHRHGHRRTLCATLRGQRHCAACGRALRARAGVAGMQRGAWRTVGGSRGRAECGQADRGGRACVWAQCGWVGRGAAGPAREGGCGRENEPLGAVGSFRGPGPPGRPPDMTPNRQARGTVVPWSKGCHKRLEWVVLRPPRPHPPREPPELALSAPFCTRRCGTARAGRRDNTHREAHCTRQPNARHRERAHHARLPGAPAQWSTCGGGESGYRDTRTSM